MLSQSSETCLRLLGEMSQRIRGLVQEIDNLSVQNGRNRLSSYLLQQAGDENHIRLPIPKAILASRLSIQPETFSRIIKQLKSVSVIAVDGSEIEILDRQQLEEYAMTGSG
jgi:CRP-like cAMP-binding protein